MSLVLSRFAACGKSIVNQILPSSNLGKNSLPNLEPRRSEVKRRPTETIRIGTAKSKVLDRKFLYLVCRLSIQLLCFSDKSYFLIAKDKSVGIKVNVKMTAPRMAKLNV